MRLNVNPNRMELLKLKKRIVLAHRGHKLLKDKQDELMRYFLSRLTEVKKMRKEVENDLIKAHQNMLMARAISSPQIVEEALLYPSTKIEIESFFTPLMNLRLVNYRVKIEEQKLTYGLVNTSSKLDYALDFYAQLLPKMIKLAELEKNLEIIAKEITLTRRRVNALEYILIPDLKETIRYITMKLMELERGNLVRLMKVKEIVRKH
ncbi:V-type ATP synthase subunit D [bacterium]|nr:V-type ATP synthase subunit D [bacterium]